jgi:hypothetical protein
MTGFIMLDNPNPNTAQGTFPRRGGAKLSGTAVVHTSEGNWRGGVGALTTLVRTRSSYGCYHQGCDWVDIARYYPWEWETWQDTETNNWAVGIAAACKTSDWGNMPPEVEEGYYRNLARMAADFVVYMRDTYRITVPLRRITGAEARARVPGFCAHGDSGIARSDPGANFNWGRFFDYTNQALNGADVAFTPEQEKRILANLDYIVSPEFKAHFWAGSSDVERNARRQFVNELLNTDIPWYGWDGKVPESGRTTTTPAVDMGWNDARMAGLISEIRALRAAVDGIAPEDFTQLKERLEHLKLTVVVEDGTDEAKEEEIK